jgi:hypothetical protein
LGAFLVDSRLAAVQAPATDDGNVSNLVRIAVIHVSVVLHENSLASGWPLPAFRLDGDCESADVLCIIRHEGGGCFAPAQRLMSVACAEKACQQLPYAYRSIG